MPEQVHIPVLLKEVQEAACCEQGGVFVDGTFGAGGYTRAFLRAHPCTRVIAFDRDPDAIARAECVKQEFGNRFKFIHDCFGNMALHIHEKVDAIVLDLGVSSMQIDEAQRGFSLRFDGPLDMRMAQEGMSAFDIVNTYSEQKLADILFSYGEEKASRRIAKAIVQERSKNPIASTQELAHIIHQVMPYPKDGTDSATRSFQALRIAVNDELGELERALESSLSLLKENGRLVVVSFHSLEDRIVKNFLIRHSDLKPNANRHALENFSLPDKNEFMILNRKPITPSLEELQNNPRSHSAKLRLGVRINTDLQNKQEEA